VASVEPSAKRWALDVRKARRIAKVITQGFSDENLKKELLSRGNGWRCHQRLFRDGFAVEAICWRRQVVIAFTKR
jgi:hypothetical protein